MFKIIAKKLLLLLIIILIVAGAFLYIKNSERVKKEIEQQELLKSQIEESFNKYVVTTSDVVIYKLENDNYVEAGKIGEKQQLELKDIDITYQTEYFPLLTFDEYYISYKDVNKIEQLDDNNNRYKRYIPFNENIETNNITNFYDENNNLIYTFNQSYTFPIIVKDVDRYGIEFNNRLLYVNKIDVSNVYFSNNTELVNTSSIPVLNYHFFYDEDNYDDRNECNQIICISTQRFRSHLDYIKNNNIFTPKLEELEMYLDGKIQLPKSVVITIDDGWRLDPAPAILAEYQLNGTAFLITSWFNDTSFINDNEYFEYHSHGEDIHNPGICSGGQGGAIKCLDRTALLNDLSTSRSKLNQTKYFCYPFYEYNSYSISVLEEAGFTMAFADGERNAYPGINKYEIPRYVMFNDTTVGDIEYIINR